MSKVGVTIDSTDAEAEIDRVEERGRIAAASIISHLRRAAQFGMALATATGGALSQQYTLMIEAALVTLDTIVQTQLAVAAGTFGVATFVQATLSGISVLLMLQTINLLRQGKTEAAQSTNRTIQMFRVFSITA